MVVICQVLVTETEIKNQLGEAWSSIVDYRIFISQDMKLEVNIGINLFQFSFGISSRGMFLNEIDQQIEESD